jgi:hypothetical protein
MFSFARVVVLCALMSFFLAACGGGGTVTLSQFAAITKTEGDAAFILTAPSSKSPAAFTFTSSDTRVATISGSTVTVLLAGVTTITAEQSALGSFSPTSATTTLTVAPIVCVAPFVRANGVCAAPGAVLICNPPATVVNGVCVAATGGTPSYFTRNGITWMPITSIATWDSANTYCTTQTINGLTGWRLPNQFELTDLFTSGAISGNGWLTGITWSSTRFEGLSGGIYVGIAGSSAYHATVAPLTSAVTATLNEVGAYVTCVH